MMTKHPTKKWLRTWLGAKPSAKINMGDCRKCLGAQVYQELNPDMKIGYGFFQGQNRATGDRFHAPGWFGSFVCHCSALSTRKQMLKVWKTEK